MTEWVMIRITEEQRDRVDALKDPLVPREAYIRLMLDAKLAELEKGKRASRKVTRPTRKPRAGR